MNVAIVNVTPFALAFLMPTVGARLRKSALAWLLGAVLAGLWLLVLSYIPAVTQQGAIELVIPWVPEISLSFSLYLDGLSLLFSLLITGIGALVVIYAGYYFDDLTALIRFYRLLLLFMGGMLGLVLAGNLLTLFICWELTSITSFFLIGFNYDDPTARKGSLQALVVTAGGGLALLVGLVLLSVAAGTAELATILSQGHVLQSHPHIIFITILIFIGSFTKSAQWPFHFWLPDAMTAPTPASAYLHSATMVKAGIYLLMRFYPVMGETVLWQGTLTVIGLITMFIGAVVALRQRDLKACLAYSTVSQLGALVALIGLPHGHGIKAAAIGVIAHALYKGTLFLVAGIVDHGTGTRDLDALGGLRRHMPGTAFIALLAGLSMAGLPPLLGFVAKEALLESLLEGTLPILTLFIVVVSAAFTVTMALILVWDVFWRKAPHTAHMHHHTPQFGMLVGPGLLAGGSLLAGLNLDGFVRPVLAPILGQSTAGLHLQLFSGVNLPLLLSAAAMLGGFAVFQTRAWWLNIKLPELPKGRDLYDAFIGVVESAANLVLRSQGGKIRYYLVIILISVTLLMATVGLSYVGNRPIAIELSGSADVLKAILLVLSLGATFASIVLKRHLIAALALGVAGYAVGGIFLLEPAPDVALVQFLVETLGTVLVITMLGRISAQERQQVIQNLWGQTKAGVVRDAIIATVIGVGVGIFSIAAVLNRPDRHTITTWHMEHATPDVGADDIVAAIVTDFRGMDTVIEITVFGMAALGVLTLLSTPEAGTTWQFAAGRILQQLRQRGLIRPERQFIADVEAKDPQIQKEVTALKAHRMPRVSTALTRFAATLVVPFAFLIALSHILYGGVAPGDGFTAGVVTGLAVALWYIVFGYEEAKRRLHWLHPAPLIGIGVGLAVLNAALPLLFGSPFLATTVLDQLHLPADIHLSSTMLFETGIFLSVLGGSSVVLETIAHPQEVETL